jgi:hypothetical protein
VWSVLSSHITVTALILGGLVLARKLAKKAGPTPPTAVVEIGREVSI